jgi:hypothetical protein
MKSISFLITLIFLVGHTIALQGQEYEQPEKPMKYWNAEEIEAFWLNQKRMSLQKPLGAADRREGIASGNLIRTVFYNYGSIGKPNWEPSIEWPKGSGHGYAYEFGPIIGAEVETTRGDTIHIVSDALIDGGDRAPRGKVWGWQPLPQYLNTAAETPAMSNNPESWPQGQTTDNPFYNPDNTGPDDMFLWPGLEGQGTLSADLEAFWVMDDRDNDEFAYYPFLEDTLRRGLGLELTCRLLQFTASLAEDIIFYIVTVRNVSDKPLDKVVVGMFGDPHIGGPGDFSDDFAGFDEATNMVFSYDAEGSGNDYSIPWSDLGWLGFKFLESPVDDDGNELGLTSMAGPLYATSFSDPSNDEMMWTQLEPGKFTNIEQNQDNIFIFGSGYFDLAPGESQQFSIAILMGRGEDDLYANAEIAQEIYDLNYKFTKAPDPPKVTVVPDDGKAVLYWDSEAENSFDDFFQSNDFEGYKIYRSTDGLKWGDPITDVNGAVRFYKPLAQYDIDNNIEGFFPADQRLGTSFYLGENTGLVHTFTDDNLVNGITYYYAVTSYDSGYKKLGIQPAESGREPGVNLQSVMPTVRAPGFKDVPIEIIHDEGYATGVITATDLDPTIIGTREYEVVFTDTSALGITYFISYLDEQGNTVYVVENSTEMAGEPIMFDGLLATLTDADGITIIDSLSGWQEGSPTNLGVEINLYPNGRRVPRDMQIQFFDSFVDTSVIVNPQPVNFKVMNVTDDEQLDAIFFDRNGDQVVNAGDQIVPVLYDNSLPVPTWQIDLLAPGSGEAVDPADGDIINMIVTKPFETIDIYRITTEPAYIDQTQAKEDFLENVAVVPNPYVVSNTFEVPPPSVFSQGRGDRRIDFIHLPPKCTIRIYTTVGELVDTIEHDTDIFDGRESWDLLTSEGLEIAYGIYVYHIDAGELGEKVDKFAIIK